MALRLCLYWKKITLTDSLYYRSNLFKSQNETSVSRKYPSSGFHVAEVIRLE